MLYDNQNQTDWKIIKQRFKPGVLLINYNQVRIRVLDGSGTDDWHYETAEPDSVFMLIKSPRIETEQAMMASIQLDMLFGEKFVRYFCYSSPWELFDIVETKCVSVEE